MTSDLPPALPPLPPWPLSPLLEGARRVAQCVQAAGYEAWLVGGCVRNWLLEAPIFDADLATSAPPEAVAALFRSAQTVGRHFGVTLVHEQGRTYEVATFRAEGSYIDRRRPSEVRYGTREEDWQRRDFTINAMYYDPVGAVLFDPAGGRGDLARRRLRTVGPPGQRFAEDALRLMRAVRFAARYALTLDGETAVAIRAEAAGLEAISIERIAGELLAILTGPHRGRAMRLLDELALWPHIVPEIPPMKGCRQPPQFHPEGDVFIHTALVLDRLDEAWPGAEPPAALALAALLHDVGKPPTFQDDGDRIRFPEHQRIGAEMAARIGRRLRLPGRLIAQVETLVAQHMRFMDSPRMKTATLRRFLGQPDFDLHLALHKADCLASHGKLDNYAFCREQMKTLAEADRQTALLPAPLINGRDVLALGVKPGPRVGELLAAAHELQLEGELATREAALAWLAEAVHPA